MTSSTQGGMLTSSNQQQQQQQQHQSSTSNNLLSTINQLRSSSTRHLIFYKNLIKALLSDDLNKESTSELHMIQDQANTIEYIILLKEKTNDNILRNLLSYLPLFNNNNKNNKLKEIYIELIQRIIDSYNQTKREFNDDYYQLITIASYHQAFTIDEQKHFKKYLKSCEFNSNNNNNNNNNNENTLMQRNGLLCYQSNIRDSKDSCLYSSDTSISSNETQQIISPSSPLQNQVQRIPSLPPSTVTNGGLQSSTNAHLALGKANSLNINTSTSYNVYQPPSASSSSSKIPFQQSQSTLKGSKNPIDLSDHEDNESNRANEFFFYNNASPVSCNGNKSDTDNGSTCSNTPNYHDLIAVNESIRMIQSQPRFEPLKPTQSEPLKSTHNNYAFRAHLTAVKSYSSSNGLDITNSYDSTGFNYNSDSDFNTFTNPGSGMRDVPVWLKSLRLHKYTPLFSKFTYEEMMNLDEKTLEGLNITLGARNKILKQISILKGRAKHLKELLQISNMSDLDALQKIIGELYEISSTPMKPYSTSLTHNSANLMSETDDNLVLFFLELLEKIYTELSQPTVNINDRNYEDVCIEYLKLIDRLHLKESFSDYQKKQLQQWRKELFEKNPNLKHNQKIQALQNKTKKPAKCIKSNSYAMVKKHKPLTGSYSQTYEKASKSMTNRYDQQENHGSTLNFSSLWPTDRHQTFASHNLFRNEFYSNNNKTPVTRTLTVPVNLTPQLHQTNSTNTTTNNSLLSNQTNKYFQ